MTGKKLVYIILSISLLLTVMTTEAYALPGSSESDPLVCTDFDQLKAALEDPSIKYVKAKDIDDMISILGLPEASPAIMQNGDKYLILEGSSRITSSTNSASLVDSLIGVTSTLIIEGDGSLEYRHKNYRKGYEDALLKSYKPPCNIIIGSKSKPTLKVEGIDGTYSTAILLVTGKLTVYDGVIYSQVPPSIYGSFRKSSAIMAYFASEIEIYGGTFGASDPIYQAYGLFVSSDNTKVTIREGLFINGIETPKGSKHKIKDFLAEGTKIGKYPLEKSLIFDGNTNEIKDHVKAWNDTPLADLGPVDLPGGNKGSNGSNDKEVINELDLYVDEPEVGIRVDGITQVDLGENVTLSKLDLLQLNDDGNPIRILGDKFQPGVTYRVQILVYPKGNYQFSKDTRVRINSEEANIYSFAANYITAYIDYKMPAKVDSGKDFYLNTDELMIDQGETGYIRVSDYKPANSREKLRWLVEDESIVKVDLIAPRVGRNVRDSNYKFQVEGLKAGSTKVTVSSVNTTSEFTVIVKEVLIKEVINELDLYMDEPKSGMRVDELTQVDFGENITLGLVEWYELNDDGQPIKKHEDKFLPGVNYRVHIIVYPKDNYTFSENIKVKINNIDASGHFDPDFFNAYIDYEIPTDEKIEEKPEEEKVVPDEDKNKKFPFTDVAESSWYRNDVEIAYYNGLINGKTATEYKPDDNMSIAEAIKLAASMHQLYHDGLVTLTNGSPWYQSYVTYAFTNGIISGPYSDYNKSISRDEFVYIFYGSLPDNQYKEINLVGANKIPDVNLQDKYSIEIYTFYRAGILTGSDSAGKFNPKANIKRSEVAAILTRMFDESARKPINLP